MAKMKSIQGQGVDYPLSTLQANIKEILDPISANPILAGHFINNVALVTGAQNKISHGLGRNIVGYIVTNQTALAFIYAVPGEQSLPNRTLVLEASADTTVNLYVF